jgi:2-polyprenyl-3-methyl-5-hydroxy-6-metoxy-1,4-benzoquinol methylase
LRDAVLDGWFLNDSGELLKGFAITPDDTLLDVGCGEGAATLFAVRQGASVIFTDSEHDKVSELARQVEAKSSRPSLGLVSNSLPLPLADGCASRVVCMEVLEHVDEPEPFMAELARMGRPGALYLLSVPAPVGRKVSPPRVITSLPIMYRFSPRSASRRWSRMSDWSSNIGKPPGSSG